MSVMLPNIAMVVGGLVGSIDDLIEEIGRLSGRSEDAVRAEVSTQLALRLSLLILGELEGSVNYSVVKQRIQSLFPKVSDTKLNSTVDSFAKALVLVESSEVGPKLRLQDISYPTRRKLFARQGNRCGICGWSFQQSNYTEREEWAGQPCLDHKVPNKIGGEKSENLWITCSLCNTLKEAALHIGEHGRIWSNNALFRKRGRSVAFWTLIRDGKCSQASCDVGPNKDQLFVERVSNRGAWVADNCRTRCISHLRFGMQGALLY